jgi:hypothetical protein
MPKGVPENRIYRGNRAGEGTGNKQVAVNREQGKTGQLAKGPGVSIEGELGGGGGLKKCGGKYLTIRYRDVIY